VLVSVSCLLYVLRSFIFQSKDNAGNGNSRGRYKFVGRQGYLSSKTQTEKWKHDLYKDIDKDAVPAFLKTRMTRLQNWGSSFGFIKYL